MFSGTPHVETVVLLSKGIIDSQKVKVEMSLADMDMSGFKKGATYEAIKDYVKEQTGYNLRQKPKKYILLLIIPKAYKKIPCKSS